MNVLIIPEEPFARGRGVLDEPEQGRLRLATEAAERYPRIRR